MPERGFQTETWTDPWFQEMQVEQRYLFIYLWTNEHCNQAGLYQITIATIAFETKLSAEKLPELLKSLAPKIEWYPDDNLIWVRNFLKRQAKSPKFLVAAANCLKTIPKNNVVKEFLEYNNTLSIPYQYTSRRISIPSSASASAKAKADLGALSPDEKEIMHRLVKLKGWQADEDDVLWLQGLEIEIPGLTLADFKACVDYHSGRPPPKHKGIWKNRLRNWMIKKQEFEAQRSDSGQRGRRRVEPRTKTKDFEGKW